MWFVMVAGICLQQPNLASFAPEYYWRSTEASVSKAWLQSFGTGSMLQF